MTDPTTRHETAPPPADDARTEEPTAAARRRRLPGLLPVVALGVLTALLLLTGWFTWHVVEDRRTQTARDEAVAAARDAARLLFSYDHERLQQDFEAGLEVATGEFREQYERTTREVVQPVAEEYDVVVEAAVSEAGVVRAEPGRAVVLVFLNQTTTSTRVEGPQVDQSRVRMTLRKDDDRWLVERVDAL